MAHRKDKKLVYKKINEYIDIIKKNHIPIWRLYLYGSYAKNTYNSESDIDLAIFLEKNDLDGFEEDSTLMKLRRIVDLRIEPHPFAKTDFDETNPYIREIIKTGERII
ncbi:MAG: nucleotidyltransferase domain-containing protein [Candidatus Scalindua sp.]|nr:nucleotidyltransferase domain-containing protein [Candidatus Scalindua sp.]